MANRSKFLYILLVLTGITVLIPILFILLWSFTGRWPWPLLLPESLSLRGAIEIFAPHSKAIPILFSSILLSLLVALVSTVIGMMSARAFAFYEFKGKSMLRFLSMLPVIIPANVFAMGIHVLFIRWRLNDSVFGLVICHIIYSLPYTVNILTAAQGAIGRKYEEQAAVLGGAFYKSLLGVTFPLMLPSILSAVSMAYIISFSQYFLTLLIGGGKVKTFSVIMVPFISGGDRTIASAYVLVFLISSLFTFIVFDYIAGKVAYEAKT